jgi:DNA-binding MarR family transcriptional regulator
MDAALREYDLTVPQYSCLEQLAHQPGLTNTELARGTFVSRQAMHQLLATLKSLDLVHGDGGGRHEHFTLTNDGARRLHGASTAVAAVQERMLAPFDPGQRQRLHADLTACADALNQ